MLNNGTFNGKRLVSEKGFDELIRKQMNIGGNIDYGLGWFLREWNGHKVVEHGGKPRRCIAAFVFAAPGAKQRKDQRGGQQVHRRASVLERGEALNEKVAGRRADRARVRPARDRDGGHGAGKWRDGLDRQHN